ncbi:unnamed protein product [Closterium sp. NIES-64]|nr:unnamed protein product [Closterium sp. NIES-64]
MSLVAVRSADHVILPAHYLRPFRQSIFLRSFSPIVHFRRLFPPSSPPGQQLPAKKPFTPRQRPSSNPSELSSPFPAVSPAAARQSGNNDGGSGSGSGSKSARGSRAGSGGRGGGRGRKHASNLVSNPGGGGGNGGNRSGSGGSSSVDRGGAVGLRMGAVGFGGSASEADGGGTALAVGALAGGFDVKALGGGEAKEMAGSSAIGGGGGDGGGNRAQVAAGEIGALLPSDASALPGPVAAAAVNGADGGAAAAASAQQVDGAKSEEEEAEGAGKEGQEQEEEGRADVDARSGSPGNGSLRGGDSSGGEGDEAEADDPESNEEAVMAARLSMASLAAGIASQPHYDSPGADSDGDGDGGGGSGGGSGGGGGGGGRGGGGSASGGGSSAGKADRSLELGDLIGMIKDAESSECAVLLPACMCKCMHPRAVVLLSTFLPSLFGPTRLLPPSCFPIATFSHSILVPPRFSQSPGPRSTPVSPFPLFFPPLSPFPCTSSRSAFLPQPHRTPGRADILLLNRVRSRALEELSEARMQNDGLQNQLRIFQARIAEADAKLHLAVQSRERSSLLETQLRVLQEQVEELGEADGEGGREGEGEGEGAEAAEEEVVGELEKQVAELRARVEDGEEAEARLEILQGRNEALQQEVEEGIRQAEAARKRAEEVERRLREEMEGLTERLVRLQAELAVSQAKEKELEDAVAVKGLLEREVGDLRGKVAEKEAEMAQAVQEREEEVARLRERLEREVGELGKKVREEGERRRAAEEERERLDGEIAALKTEVEEREEALRRELEEVAGKLRREVEEREAVVGEEVQEREALVAKLKQEVDELTERVGEKERERERAEAEVGELRKRVEAAEEVVRAKQGEVEVLQEEQAEELRALVARLGEETAQMRKALQGKEQEVAEVEAARGKLEEVVSRTEGWLGEVRGENADLRAQLAALQQQMEESEEKRELVVQLTEEEERKREEQRQQLVLQLQQAQERVGELERKQEMVAKVEAEISLLQSAIEEAEGLERISAAVAEQNEELQGELARLREEVAAAEAARAREQEERQAEKEDWWRLAEETEAYRAQVGVLRSELMKTDELMRAQLELYEAQMAAFQESLDAANESVEVYRARAAEATAAAEEAAAMAADAEAVAAQWEEAAASGALGELNLGGMTSGFVTSGSSSSSSGGRWQRPAVVAAGELPWEYWSSLLLKLDELLLRRVLTTEEVDELRDMAWRREKAIRDAWDSVGGAEVVQAVAAGGNSDAVLGRDAVVAGALRGVLGGEQPPLPPLHVVHIAAEMAPVAKVGGLADVITGLSKALQRRGHLVEIILPKYDCMDYSRINDLKPLDLKFSSFFDNEMHACKIWRGMVEGLPVYFIEPLHPARMFWRGTFYGCNDDFRRFTLFCRAALEFLYVSHKRPDIIHTHDWQTAVVAPLYWDVYVPKGLNSAQLAFTCHNFEYQGSEHASALAACGLDVNRHNVPERMRDNFMHDRVNLLKAGIVFSGVVTTVSPTYAMEVRGPEGGRGLHLTLGQHEKKFFGVLNGIDSEVWDPATDPLLCCPYSAAEPEGKAENKAYLKSMLGLSSSGPDAHKPLVGCITRLVPQKGVHLIRHAIYRTLERGGQFVLLGSSPVPDIQKDFEGIERQFSSDPNIRLVLKYDESLSHLIYAGSDLFIIPSIFEPCGLTQLIAMRYGSIPIVRKTGGLADSVFDVDDPSIPVEKRNGFSFTASDVNALNYALDRAITAYYERREWWVQLVAHTMAMDFGWEQSSRQYEQLYHRCLPHRRTW